MKGDYITEINKLLKETEDIEMLDLVYQLLQKSRVRQQNGGEYERNTASH